MSHLSADGLLRLYLATVAARKGTTTTVELRRLHERLEAMRAAQ